MPELPFTLDQLRILKAIAAQGSFKKAADLLYVDIQYQILHHCVLQWKEGFLL